MSGDVAPQKPEPTSSWSTTPRVLVVEDDHVSRNLCTKYVQGYGCSVVLAFDGASAVNKMNAEKFDLVFMVRSVTPSLAPSCSDHYEQDITAPKLDGCSATTMIRQFNRTTPIVAVTSNTKPTHVMSYFAAGMNDVLGKPFAKSDVTELLEVGCVLVLAFFSRF
jgi:osomolarity two-component system response regulator SKN7